MGRHKTNPRDTSKARKEVQGGKRVIHTALHSCSISTSKGYSQIACQKTNVVRSFLSLIISIERSLSFVDCTSSARSLRFYLCCWLSIQSTQSYCCSCLSLRKHQDFRGRSGQYRSHVWGQPVRRSSTE